ncbi:MAG: hypothetical protein A2017_03170 [Lentisphaerae bacterium GWF2_44_16]|nr:MAG: hypothetical protein A2017_03170 [Lentisphaerae bacterium GWF2_44_16]
MNMMKFFFLMSLFSLPFLISAQNTANKTTDKSTNKLQVQKIKYPSREEFDMRSLSDTVKQRNEEAIQKYKKFKGIEWAANAQMYLIWSEHPYIEEASRIDRRWFSKVSQIMSSISKWKNEMEVSSERNLTERYNRAKAGYENLLKTFLVTIKKPTMLSDENKKRQGR